MDGSTVAFIICACAASFIIGCSYIGMLRFLGFLEGDPRGLDGYVKWAWFVVWFAFVMGLALILV